MIKVSIVEDDCETRTLISELLKSDSSYCLVGDYGTAKDYLACFASHLPDVVILDIHLPGISGIDCLKRAKPLYPDIQYIMFTVFEDDESVFESLKAGATGYLLKKTSPSGIFEAIESVYSGGSPMSPLIARKVITSMQKTAIAKANPHVALLTARENEILQALARGLRYKEISDTFFISMDTVRSHIRKIYEKLQVNSRIEAVNKTTGRHS